jgi:urease accessory protein UreF
MMVGTKVAPSSPAELLGDPHPLLEQLGSPEDLAMTGSVARAVQFQQVIDAPSLGRFLDSYRTQVLIPVELPAIVAAYHHASRGEANELVTLDAQMGRDGMVQQFAMASCRVGQRQLGKLRPMRDQRVVQRYLAAIENGQARGWHTLVYGVSLAMFSLPLRQGLQNYATHTFAGFVQSAAKSLRLIQSECDLLLSEQTAAIPPAIASALNAPQVLALP